MNPFNKGEHMIRAALSFFILALFAFVLGAYGVAGMSMEIGKILLVVFFIFAAVSFIGAMLTGRRINGKN